MSGKEGDAGTPNTPLGDANNDRNVGSIVLCVEEFAPDLTPDIS